MSTAETAIMQGIEFKAWCTKDTQKSKEGLKLERCVHRWALWMPLCCAM